MVEAQKLTAPNQVWSGGNQSTTQQGDAFRDLVADLLRTRYPDTATEQRIAGTKVDITFSDYNLELTEVVTLRICEIF